jgi:superfamily II DNA or RNA helicase
MINRFSSRIGNLAESFFKDSLVGASSYDRIAGYFSSSIIEIAGESIEQMEGKVRIVCNSQLQAEDVKYIKDQPQAMKVEWCDGKPEETLSKVPERLTKLHELLVTKKIDVRVLPNDIFGLIHGKAGVITTKDGKKVAFLGSMNETYSGWSHNYELAWVDDDTAAIQWVQKEFDALWEHPLARPLTDFIIEDIKRIAERKVIYTITDWKTTDTPAATVIETPVYRKEFGLWEHQKYFVDLAYRAHRSGLGARFILADMVGLGKTVQLALSAMLMALEGSDPVLIIVPKTLIWQWQEEMTNLLDMPSAVWNGRCWVDENGVEYPESEENALSRCPRKVGIISQGLIVRSRAKVSEVLLKRTYECVIVDESHRARRKNITPGLENEQPQPNNLMAFLLEISKKTKSLLLATATPVQINPIEAWDLLYILSQNNDFVLGDTLSRWQGEKARSLSLITGRDELDSDYSRWDWLKNPFPPAEEKPTTFGVFRKQYPLSPNEFIVRGDMNSLPGRLKSIVSRIFADDFIKNYNPYIRHIIRRERKFLETTINPETNQPYLKPIKVELFGEGDDEGLQLSTHLYDAYHLAEQFSELLSQRVKSSGFIKTMLLRRICSSMHAGNNTALGILENWAGIWDEDDDFDDENNTSRTEKAEPESPFKNLTRDETACLQRFVAILEEYQDRDPKYDLLKSILLQSTIIEPWLNRGCIVFSQYFDTIQWICNKFANEFPNIKFGLYAGGDKSGIYENGIYYRKSKDDIKKMVRARQIQLLFGTDAASEGLNLQALGTLINLDLPWNPTRLEQRKGRIQRIGQERDEVLIYNMRYKDSVEDRVHRLLSSRLKNIQDLFGQIPDTLEDVWVEVALNRIEEAEKHIDDFSETDTHPFYKKYQDQANIKPIKWEDCSLVLDSYEKKKFLMQRW